jgi:hypothetical protein
MPNLRYVSGEDLVRAGLIMPNTRHGRELLQSFPTPGEVERRRESDRLEAERREENRLLRALGMPEDS